MRPEADIVFVVDDDVSVRRALARLLRSAGWKTEEYASGEAFLKRLPYPGAGCTILDVSMPRMNGYEVQQRLSVHAPQLPVIFLSGHSCVPTSRLRSGAMDVLFKPVDATLLLDAVNRAMLQSRSRLSRDVDAGA